MPPTVGDPNQRDRSSGAFDLPEGTVYPALHRLETAGPPMSSWDVVASRRRRRGPRSDRPHVGRLRGPCARRFSRRPTEREPTVNFILVMRNEKEDLVAIGPVSIEYQAAMLRDELEESTAGRPSGSPGC